MTEFKFYVPSSTTPSTILTGTLVDRRNFFNINLVSNQFTNVKSAQVIISKTTTTSNGEQPSTYAISVGQNYVVPTSANAKTTDIKHPFVDNTYYTVKVTALLSENGNDARYDAKFGTNLNLSYSFLYRADGGDKFNNSQLAIQNEASVEGAAGSVILLRCPINFANQNDNRTPSSVLFSFSEVSSYVTRNTNLNTLTTYSVKLAYQSSGNYTLTQTETNKLTDDKAYDINAFALYSDGYSTNSNFPRKLHVIERPAIHSVIAYGLGTNQSDADVLTTSSVMNLYMRRTTIPQDNLPSASGNITFKLSQGGVTMYTVSLPVSSNVVDGTILYTVLKADLVKVWTTTAPTQNPNKSYTYDISARIEHLSVNRDASNNLVSSATETILKESPSVSKTFTSDIVPFNSVVTLNAWIGGANVDGSGDRTVNISNTTTASGYNSAPELGIVGKFSKTDFYGSGVTDGFFKDLDAVVNGVPVTNHRFTLRVNNALVPVSVTELHQIQGHDDKTDQEMYIELFQSLNNSTSPNKYTNANGLFPNLPGPANILGSAQKPIYFLIPNGFSRSDSVVVSVAIEPVAGETTRPSATNSNSVVVVPKVNKYVMTVGTASEPRFTQNIFTVPINNPIASEPNFASAIFTSNLAAPNALKEVNVSNNGVFDISLENPSIRGANCDYQVRYKINDPNSENGTITGPISDTYRVPLFDPPELDNFTINNYSYDTFNDNNVSKIKFNIVFQTVQTRTIDGVFVYFRTTNDDAVENDIPLTLLMDVKRSDGNSQSNLVFTLQDTAAANATFVKIKNKNGDESSNKWLNFRSGDIVFKPYQLVPNFDPDIRQVETVKKIHNIPVIPVPTNVALTGGVKESYDATKATWDDGLSVYASSPVTSAYKLTLKENDASGNDVSGQVLNHSYTINLIPYAAGTVLSLSLQIKITSADNLVYYSKPIGIDFTVASVNVSALVSTVVRGSNNSTLKVQRNDYVASGANVTEVKLISNHGITPTTDPTHSQVKVLTYSIPTNSVQPISPTVNDYNLDGYALGNVLKLQYRLKAGVSYNLLSQYVNGTASSVVPTQSTPLFLTLQSPILPYTVAGQASLQIGPTYSVMSSGTYADRIAISAPINANGLHAEGVQSVVFVLAQESNLTNPNLSQNGVQHVITFESSSGLTKSYTVGLDASANVSTDNLGANEVHELSVTDLAGFAEGAPVTHMLVMGNLLANDNSMLYLGRNAFNTNLPITVVAFVSTRLGSVVAFKEVIKSA
jgi:hypothetical protein